MIRVPLHYGTHPEKAKFRQEDRFHKQTVCEQSHVPGTSFLLKSPLKHQQDRKVILTLGPKLLCSKQQLNNGKPARFPIGELRFAVGEKDF